MAVICSANPDVTKGIVCLIAVLKRCNEHITRRNRCFIALVMVVFLLRVAFVFLLPPPTIQPGWWVGRLEGIPYASGNSLFLPIKPVEGMDAEMVGQHCEEEAVGSRVQLSGLSRALGESVYVPGACVLLKLEPPKNAHAVSDGLWAQRQRIVARYRISAPLRYLDRGGDPVSAVRLYLRRIFEEITTDGRFRLSAPIALGLVTGDRALMKPWMWDIFSRTGTSHLMSISGSHVTSIALLFYLGALGLFKRTFGVSGRVPAQHLALLVSLVGALGYGLLAGMNVPTQRTLAMMAAACVAKLRGGSLLSWETLGMAALALSFADPLALIDVGAWLSFSAVALIMLVTSGYLQTPSKVRIWVAVQCGLFLGLAPVSAAVFGGYSLVGPLANAVAIPVVGLLVTPLSLLAGLLMACWSGSGPWMFLMLDPLVGLLFSLLQWLAGWDWAMMRLPALGPVVTLFSVVGALMALMPIAMPFRFAALALMLPSMMGPGFSTEHRWIDVSTGRKWDVLIDAGSRVIRIQQAAGYGSDLSLKAWAEQNGYVLMGGDSVNSWISRGFSITVYDKWAGLPGQLMLKPRDIRFPCVGEFEPGPVDALRASETMCWVIMRWRGERWLFADDMGRDTQLQFASMPWRADRLVVSPGSTDRLLGALATREGLGGVIFGPGTSSGYRSQRDMLNARGLMDGRWEEAGFFNCGTHKAGWLRCWGGGFEQHEKIAADWPVM